MSEDKIKKQKEDEQLKDEQLDEVNGGILIRNTLSNI